MMMNKHILLIIFCLLQFACSGKHDLSEEVEARLEQIYKEPFKVTKTYHSVMAHSYQFFAYPINDKDFIFQGSHNADLSYFDDGYMSDYFSRLHTTEIKDGMLQHTTEWTKDSDNDPEGRNGLLHIIGEMISWELYDSRDSIDLHNRTLDDIWNQPEQLCSSLVVFLVGDIKDFHQDGSLRYLYDQCIKIMVYENSFFGLSLFIWSTENLPFNLSKKMEREIEKNPHSSTYADEISKYGGPFNELSLHYRTDSIFHKMSYDDFYQYLTDMHSDRNLVNLNEMMEILYFNSWDVESIMVKHNELNSSESVIYTRGEKDSGDYGTWYAEGNEIANQDVFWDFLDPLETISTERFIDSSETIESEWEWHFQEEDIEYSLKIQAHSEGYICESSLHDKLFILKDDQIRGLFTLFDYQGFLDRSL